MNKIKLLHMADSPAQSTGFSRVSQGILESLYRTGMYDISMLGINHQVGDPHRYEGMFRIYPARTPNGPFGFDRVREVIAKERPDIIIINNDLWILAEYLRHMPGGMKVIGYSPVDAGPVQEDWMQVINKVRIQQVVYTEFARNEVQDLCDGKVEIIGHGVDTDEFYPIEDARKLMVNIPEDAFIVQYCSRNQPRKRIDLFLRACANWFENLNEADKKRVYFYLHACIVDVGWNIAVLGQRWGLGDHLMITDQNGLTPAKGVPLRDLCKIYNIADVHVNTSVGEGWCLPVCESAATRTAQVVPNHSAFTELWTDRAPLINIARREVLSGGINTEGSVIDIDHFVSILDDLYRHPDKTKMYADLAYEYTQREEFTWDYIAKQFHNLIIDVLNSPLVTVELK